MPIDAERLRQLPSVDQLLQTAVTLIDTYGRETVRGAIRDTLSTYRTRIRAGDTVAIHDDDILAEVLDRLEIRFQPSLRPVINATGIIIHTNLGRAPLSTSAIAAMTATSRGYSTLEFDLKSGGRGSRTVHAEVALCELTGTEAALVVNNNAAAIVLMLSALASGREVIVSRGELVEIGGGFRVPEIMAQSGARLVEVGTTNRTRSADYARAITEDTALLMRVHASNFKQIGFTEAPNLADLAALAHAHKLHLVDDLGSGALIDTALYGLDHEPTVQESVAAGCDVIAFSGDKLLGGPQAGILVGHADLITRLKRHPLARAFRADKLCLAALSATLDHYRRGEALQQIPVLRMIARPLDDIGAAAHRWARQVDASLARVIPGESAVGGGSLPGTTLPTHLVALDVPDSTAFQQRLRTAQTPVIARIAADQVLLDPRTVLPDQEDMLLTTVKAALG
ncbi:MAG: L-seryl-tRNA(Sec) selenium transferase [Chloroflexota bacterium]